METKTKTILICEDNWEKLKEMKKEGNTNSMDEVLHLLLKTRLNLKDSMFGVLEKKKTKLTQKEHEEIVSDENEF